MSAHLAVFEYAQVILMRKVFNVSQAHELTFVVPCDEVVAIAAFDAMQDKFLRTQSWSDGPEQVVLATAILWIFEVLPPDAHALGRAAYGRMERGKKVPEHIFGAIKKLIGIYHAGSGDFLDPVLE